MTRTANQYVVPFFNPSTVSVVAVVLAYVGSLSAESVPYFT